jgi:Fic family protein
MAQGKKTVKDEGIIQMFQESSDPVFSAPECAERWNMTTEGARGRLESLADQGILEKKKSGHRTTVYWLPGS